MDSMNDGLDIFPELDGVEVIQRTPIFAKLGFEETTRLAEIMHVEQFPRGKVIIEQDSLGQALYIVRSGEVSIFRHDSKGERDLLNKLGTGELFGEMSLIDDTLVSADVEVSSDSAEVVVIPRDQFERLLAADDRIAAKVYKSFCRTLSDRLRKLNVKYAELHDAQDDQTRR